MICETYDLINATENTIQDANILFKKITSNDRELSKTLTAKDIKYLKYLLSMDIIYAKEVLKSVENTAKKSETICLSRIFE